MDPRDMPAGPELDRLVAEKVMGWLTFHTSMPHEPLRWYAQIGDVDDERHDLCFQPSTNIAHAWEVVEAIKGNGPRDHHLTVTVYGEETAVGFEEYGSAEWWVRAETAPLAICRAALKACQ